MYAYHPIVIEQIKQELPTQLTNLAQQCIELPNHEHTTVLNISLNLMNGRQKLIKYLESIGLHVRDNYVYLGN